MQRLGVYLCYASVWSSINELERCAKCSVRTIVGKVVDPQGTVILDAKVTAVNTTRGVQSVGEHDLKRRLCYPQPSSGNV